VERILSIEYPDNEMDILIVGDFSELSPSLTFELQKLGHRIRPVVSGEACLHLLEEEPSAEFGSILINADMSGLGAADTTRLIREAFPEIWTPIIFLSSSRNENLLSNCIESGGDDFLFAPINSALINAKLGAIERFIKIKEELNRANLELVQMSARDGLTKLLNRRTFDERAGVVWQDAVKQKMSGALLLIDIDHFKQYNDHYGHLQGDECLESVAGALKKTLSNANAVLGRYGGEEFIAFIPNMTQAGVSVLAEAIRAGVADRAIPHAATEAGRVTISIGVALSACLDSHAIKDLVAVADKQLYRSKRDGRNRVSLSALDSHKTILIGHADRAEMATLSELLSPVFNIVTADTGEECIEIANYILPDLIVVCPRLTDESGIRVSSSFKYYGALSDIPILSILENDQRAENFSSMAGVCGFLKKPFKLDATLDLFGEFITVPRLQSF
jgi:diguanylate cyclase (GGDEF)-like protein